MISLNTYAALSTIARNTMSRLKSKNGEFFSTPWQILMLKLCFLNMGRYNCSWVGEWSLAQCIGSQKEYVQIWGYLDLSPRVSHPPVSAHPQRKKPQALRSLTPTLETWWYYSFLVFTWPSPSCCSHLRQANRPIEILSLSLLNIYKRKGFFDSFYLQILE